MIDTKSISYNLKSIARNYSASSVDQFCREWLVPCIEIKEVEKTDEERKNDDAKLTLQINGGMLQDLIYKQFSIDRYRFENYERIVAVFALSSRVVQMSFLHFPYLLIFQMEPYTKAVHGFCSQYYVGMENFYQKIVP